MAEKVTIQDIADLAGVSKSSVSRYLNEGYVSKENAGKIQTAIEQTGFQSNFFARRLKTKRSRLIGIVLPRMDSVTAGKFLMGVSQKLDAEGYQGLFLVSELDAKRELQNIKDLHQQGVDGVIVDSVAITDAHAALAAELSLPILFAGQSDSRVRCVKVDDLGAGRAMGTYIADKGHRRVVYLGVGQRDRAVGVERRQGFEEGLRAAAPDSDSKFVETEFSFESAYHSGAAVLSYNPTAVVCATDNIALGLLRYFHERGVESPAQISVAGFGGYDVGAVSYPALTSIAFDYVRVGAEAAQGLLDLIEEREPQLTAKLPFRLIERESVGPVSLRQEES